MDAETATVLRRRAKAALTRTKNCIDKNDQTFDKNDIRNKLEKLELIYTEFDKADAALPIESSEIEEFETKYYETKAKLQNILENLSVRTYVYNDNSDVFENVSNMKSSNFKLSKINIERFSDLPVSGRLFSDRPNPFPRPLSASDWPRPIRSQEEGQFGRDFLETNKILIPEQHGFRPRLSTTHQLLRVVEYIKEGNNMGQCTAAVFLDIQKAFDRVWHTGLLFKLINYNIPTPLILLLKSYISNRTFTVKINRTYSQTRSISAGIAQGSILGPVLFNLYVNDILKSTKTMLCMYADDTAILSKHKNLNTLVENINEHLAHLEIWFSVWKIALNSSKTEAVFFSQRVPPPEITLQNQRIPWSHHTKYLGVYLDKTPTFRQHITQIRTKFKNVTHKYYSLICRKSNLSRRNKLLIYTLILKPLLTYAAPVWGHAARTNINLLESSQNLIIRQILDAHWYMRNVDLRRNFNIPTIRQTIRKISTNFFKTVDEHDCPSIQDIPNYYSHFSVRRPRDVLVNPDFD
ncbi:RNA-directed DNA polymerase from mobile element jockey [Trichonephila clavipes]|nr:RNA-directed DNA polymerase from mobile element jockey [Trichonephila clavipes]